MFSSYNTQLKIVKANSISLNVSEVICQGSDVHTMGLFITGDEKDDDEYDVGDMITVECSPGYALNDAINFTSTILWCGFNATWVGDDDICERRSLLNNVHVPTVGVVNLTIILNQSIRNCLPNDIITKTNVPRFANITNKCHAVFV